VVRVEEGDEPMTMVSIRVSKETQDVLREIAEQERRPMSTITDEALRAYRRELLWRRAEADYARLAADEEQFRDYQDEIALWDSTSSDGLDLTDSYEAS